MATALACIAVSGAAWATCTGSPRTFGQAAPACSGAYCYLVSPGAGTPESIVGSFWALGFGNPVLYAGSDNGSFAEEAGWVQSFGGPPMIYGDWSQSNQIDGCIEGKVAPGKNAEIMIAAFSDRSPQFDRSYFAVVAAARNASGFVQFDFASGIGRDITLTAIPMPLIASSVQVGPHEIQIGVSGPTSNQVDLGFYSDGTADVHDVIAGYRVYSTGYYPGTPPPDCRRETGWIPMSGAVAIGTVATVTLDCTRPYAFLAVSLVYESGLESTYLSQRSVLIECEMCQGGDADADRWTSNVNCGAVDCDDADSHTYPGASEFNDGKDNQCPGDAGFGTVDEVSGMFGFTTPGDKAALSWPAQAGATAYQVARSQDPTLAAGCTSFATTVPSMTDTQTPPSQVVAYYLVRPVAPHAGSWGKNSAGAERSTSCP